MKKCILLPLALVAGLGGAGEIVAAAPGRAGGALDLVREQILGPQVTSPVSVNRVRPVA